MNTDKPEEAMTFGELLALIGEQQRRLAVLESAFSSLLLTLDEQTTQQLVLNLRREAGNAHHDAQLQQHFARLVATLQQRSGELPAETAS